MDGSSKEFLKEINNRNKNLENKKIYKIKKIELVEVIGEYRLNQVIVLK